MSKILYYLFLKPISFLPLGVLYYVSDFLYLVLYKVLKYRQKVVRTNLVKSFPEKSNLEITKIERAFYSHFCDLLVESIRMFSTTEKELKTRCFLKNPEVMNEIYESGKSVILAGGHYNNWEIGATILSTQIKHHVIGIYAPLSNTFFNDKVLKSRSKFGMEMLSKTVVKEGFEKYKNDLTTTIFATDQSPTHSKNVHWTTFLNQPTAVALGAERFAREYNFPVVFIYVNKIKRGYYEMEAKVLEINPSSSQVGAITEKHVQWLEREILKKPEFWLWTHKRWKRELRNDDIFYKKP